MLRTELCKTSKEKAKMIYTNQRKRELNEALLSKLKNPQTKKTDGDDTHVYLPQLPPGAEEMEIPEKLEKAVPVCVRPWDNVLPVFIDMGHSFLVAFVNRSSDSMRMAEERMANHKMYYIPELTIRKGEDYGRV